MAKQQQKTDILGSIQKARAGQKRNFVQTVDLSINLKSIDFAKTENRFTANVILPHGRGKAGRVLVLADSMAPEARKVEGIDVLVKQDLLKLDKESGKHLADYDLLLAEASLMAEVGKRLGPVLAPRGKMPRPFPAGADLKTLVASASKTLVISPKTPLIHAVVGKEDMEDHKIEENVRAILDALEKNLPKGKQQLGSVYVKLTMGPSIRVV
ncbi:MAG: 50S ribosomal protein L1 [Candidatus Aenigmatarchaeota archaeon]|nr:MAG: 50S ribosomal protein L1 [Candidatus Aenigmarchaeota archaeon]